uniref:Uncharacterized protein n=1 Tax=Arundo donax TaxID=35708 RepID=A0A0A9CY09_ARUDO
MGDRLRPCCSWRDSVRDHPALERPERVLAADVHRAMWRRGRDGSAAGSAGRGRRRAGRGWVFAHNGRRQGGQRRGLPRPGLRRRQREAEQQAWRDGHWARAAEQEEGPL